MTVIEYTWVPDPRVLAQSMWQVSLALENRAVPTAFAAEQTKMDIRERFLTETDPDGNKWAQWADSYAPTALGYPNLGILRQSLKLYAAATNPGTVTTDAASATVWFDSSRLPEYAVYHQEGTAKMPARPFMGLSPQAQAAIMSAYAEWFDRSIDLYPTSTGRIGRRHAMQGVHPETGHRGFVPRTSPMPTRIG